MRTRLSYCSTCVILPAAGMSSVRGRGPQVHHFFPTYLPSVRAAQPGAVNCRHTPIPFFYHMAPRGGGSCDDSDCGMTGGGRPFARFSWRSAPIIVACLLAQLPATAHGQPAGAAAWRMFRGNARHTGLSPYVGPSTASLRWNATIGAPTYASDASSPAIGADGTLFIGTNDGNVRALSGATGALQWSYSTGGVVLSSPAVGSDGTVYAGSSTRKVYALNGSTGALQWSYVTGDVVVSSPVVGADGAVYVGSHDRKVYALH